MELYTLFLQNYPALAIIFAATLGLITDFVWAAWAGAIDRKDAFNAANWSVLIYACGVFYTLIIVEKNMYYIIAYITGGWFGTYIAVKNKK